MKTKQIEIKAGSQSFTLSAEWFSDIVMIGNGLHPGVVLSVYDSHPGFSDEQISYAIEIIECAINEGKEVSGEYSYNQLEEDYQLPEDRSSMLFTPSFTWSYVGGKTEFDRDYIAAYKAPSFRHS